ncbi:MAG: hypothetical protein F4Z85_04270 [Gemmatimonadetes bacterium]|nr:hypothetical protein [Gemmatimonadota bacterium]MYB69223.1 hypothetical protein [Gemmatimonadota bacterium]
MLLLEFSPCRAELKTWVVETVDTFALGTTQGVQVHSDSLVILAHLDANINVALGRSVIDDFDKPMPLTDGAIDLVRSEWISGTNHVFDKQFTVDLGLDRAIKRVRLLAGETALNQPEYFVRGYRLETAAQAAPQVWHLLAEQPDNFVLNVDTSADSTWVAIDERGEAIPREGRFVRLTIIRQDRSNWVAIGEIEVFGVGYVSEGFIEDSFTPPTPVNVGQIRWQVERPERTSIELQVRGVSAEGTEGPWGSVAAHTDEEFFYNGDEPVAQLAYRVRLTNSAPFVSPVLKRIAIDYDPVLVAQQLLAEVVVSDSLRKGEESTLIYRVEIAAGVDDYGVDLLRVQGPLLSVTAVRVDGRELVPTDGYTWESTLDREGMLIELAPNEQINAMATVEIEGQALFVRDKTALRFEAGNKAQGDRDGYVNWQQGREMPGATWTVLAAGTPLQLLGEVQVEPRPFSPFADEYVRFAFVVGNIEEGREVVLKVYNLTGRPVRQLAQTGSARTYQFEWDGRDESGRVVEPGLYLYEVGVAGSDKARRGTFVVAY